MLPWWSSNAERIEAATGCAALVASHRRWWMLYQSSATTIQARFIVANSGFVYRRHGITFLADRPNHFLVTTRGRVDERTLSRGVSLVSRGGAELTF